MTTDPRPGGRIDIDRDAVRRDLGDLFARYAWLAEKPARRPARALAA